MSQASRSSVRRLTMWPGSSERMRRMRISRAVSSTVAPSTRASRRSGVTSSGPARKLCGMARGERRSRALARAVSSRTPKGLVT